MTATVPTPSSSTGARVELPRLEELEPSAATRTRWFVSDSLVLARRSLSHVRQVPEKLLDVTLQPIMFVLLFAYVFGGVIAVPGGNYKEYLIGGILVQTLAFGMMGPGTAMATELTEGLLDRLRTLPMSRAAYLVGFFVAEFAAAMLGFVIMLACGLAVGWRIHSDVPHALAGIGLLVLFSMAMIWLGTLVGLVARTADAVQGIAFIVVFPMTFCASTFVPIGGLPNGLRQVAEWNPITSMAAAVRTLFGNPTAIPKAPPWPLEHPVLCAFGWSVLILVVALPAAMARYRSRTRG